MCLGGKKKDPGSTLLISVLFVYVVFIEANILCIQCPLTEKPLHSSGYLLVCLSTESTGRWTTTFFLWTSLRWHWYVLERVGGTWEGHASRYWSEKRYQEVLTRCEKSKWSICKLQYPTACLLVRGLLPYASRCSK